MFTLDPERAAKQHIAAMASAANRDVTRIREAALKHAEMLPGTTVVNKLDGRAVDRAAVVDAAMLRITRRRTVSTRRTC